MYFVDLGGRVQFTHAAILELVRDARILLNGFRHKIYQGSGSTALCLRHMPQNSIPQQIVWQYKLTTEIFPHTCDSLAAHRFGSTAAYCQKSKNVSWKFLQRGGTVT